MPRLIDLLQKQNPMFRDEYNSPCFVVDNVAEYYFHHEREFWAFIDFPHPYPPFKHLWCEYKVPAESHSKEKGTTLMKRPDGAEPYIGCFLDEVEPNWWLCQFNVFFTLNGVIGLGRTREIPTIAKIYLAPDSEYVNEVLIFDPEHKASSKSIVDEMYITHPMWMAFSFLNCKNVETVKVEVPPKLNKARRKRGNLPLHDFHLVNILPMGVQSKVKRVIPLSGNIHAAVGDIKLRRGNFATYSDEDGHRLFGKYTGRYWRPAVQKAETGKYDVRIDNKS